MYRFQTFEKFKPGSDKIVIWAQLQLSLISTEEYFPRKENFVKCVGRHKFYAVSKSLCFASTSVEQWLCLCEKQTDKIHCKIPPANSSKRASYITCHRSCVHVPAHALESSEKRHMCQAIFIQTTEVNADNPFITRRPIQES